MKFIKKDPFTIQEHSTVMRDGSLTDYTYNNKLGSFFVTDQPSNMWLGKVISLIKFNLFFVAMAVFFLILFSRLVFLQMVKGPDYRKLAEGNRIRSEYLLPNRGIIFDRFHKPMVENVSAFSLYYDAKDTKRTKAETADLNNFLTNLNINNEKISTSTIDQIFSKQSSLPILLKEKLDYQTALHLMIDLENYPDLKIVMDPSRNYLSPDNATAHLLGYTSRITAEDKDNYLNKGYLLIEHVGRTGIEGYYQDYLRGTPGARKIEVDSMGRQKKVIAEDLSQPGSNLILGIDKDLQEVIAQSFKKYAASSAGAAIAIDPRNGQIRALFSWPTYDNNVFSQNLTADFYNKILNDPLKPLINRTISAEYPSGSTIKLAVSAAGLEEKVITKDSTVLSTGGVWYDKWFFPDWKAGGHGITNVTKALAWSVNTFFYYLGIESLDGHIGLGINRLTEYLKKFGIGSPTNIDLKGEKVGLVPTPDWKVKTKKEIWYPGDTMHLAIGQGDLLVTPLQIANITAAVANGGTLYQPQILSAIEDPVTNQQQIITPKILNQGMVSRANIAIVAEGLRDCVTLGSCRGVAIPNLDIAGKTGTAQAGENKAPHAWFTSFAPYEDPELVLTIFVEHGGEGSGVAVPIAHDIWQWYADNRYQKVK